MLLVESEEDARIEENYIRIYFLLKVRYDFVLLLSLFLSSFFSHSLIKPSPILLIHCNDNLL